MYRLLSDIIHTKQIGKRICKGEMYSWILNVSSCMLMGRMFSLAGGRTTGTKRITP